jgi:hypothetical protein
MGLPKNTRALDRVWNGADANLENELLLYDFFRREEGYSPERPLIVCKDGVVMALYRMEGIDPEPLGGDGLAGASAALRRAFDVLNPAALEGEWRRGTWEVQNIFTRGLGLAPSIAPPTRDSEALRYLCEASNEYWRKKTVFQDEIVWAFKFVPRFREKRTLSWIETRGGVVKDCTSQGEPGTDLARGSGHSAVGSPRSGPGTSSGAGACALSSGLSCAEGCPSPRSLTTDFAAGRDRTVFCGAGR